MSHHLYSSHYGSGGGGGSDGGYSSHLPPSITNSSYHPSSSLFGSSNLYSSGSDPHSFSAYNYSSSYYGGGGGTSVGPTYYDSAAAVAGMKRPTATSAEAFYHHPITGNHATIGQSEDFFSTQSLAKRPRFETASNLPVYPQRPGEKDCAHYMLTRTCKFGDSCKFDHPLWVPEGGISDWKEIPLVHTNESLPERLGEPDCPYYMKTEKCKFGFQCKFNHPKGKTDASTGTPGQATESTQPVLPERPTEPICAFYAKTGKCKFGASCKFHHPKDLQILSACQDLVNTEQTELSVKDSKPEKTFIPSTPALLHNSKGMPIRPGETDCPFYLKTGSCKFGATCRFNHPESNFNIPATVALGHAMIPSSVYNLPSGVFNPAASLIPNVGLQSTQASLAAGLNVYPQRPGQTECEFYMKTGHCKFGERCVFHHPLARPAPTASVENPAIQQNVKLTLAGLPRREGMVACSYYMKTGACKFRASCKFDHPPPGEAIAMASVVGTVNGAAVATDGEEKSAAEATEQQ